MNLFTAVLYLHCHSGGVGRIVRFTLQWMYHQSPLLNQRWVQCAALQRYAAVSQRRGVNGDNALPAVQKTAHG